MKKSILGIICSILAIAFTNSCNNATKAKANENDSTAIEDSLYNEIKKGWVYKNSVDEMDGSIIKLATIVSSNAIQFDSPYEDSTKLYICIRNTKEYGNEVMIMASNGQFVSNEFDGTNYVTVRFDNDAPIKFYTSIPANGSFDALFLENPKKFIKLAKNAKTIKIKAPFFIEGSQVFTFKTKKSLVW